MLDMTEISGMHGELYCSSVLGLCVYTGKDGTRAFKGKGKVRPLNILQKYPRYLSIFETFENDWDTSDDLIKRLEKFTCCMYEHQMIRDVNQVRVIILKNGWR